MKRMGRSALCLLLLAVGCGPSEDADPIAEDGERVEVMRQSFVADDLYNLLRRLEYALPPVPASASIAMGSWVGGGNFSGLASTCSIVRPPKAKVCTPPTATINGINAILHFDVPGGVTLTANGKTATSGYSGGVSLDVGNASTVSWTLQSGSYSYSDKLFIARPDVGGAGAFTIAALPLTIVYDPQQNAARTNGASTSFGTESTVVNTIATSNSTANAPEWAEGKVAKALGAKLATWAAGKFAADPGNLDAQEAFTILKNIESVWGTVETSVTHDSTVTTEKSLSVKISASQSIGTTTRGGPGHGDLIVFYKDARVAWGMDQGRVSLTLIDHGPLALLTVDTLKADLAAVRAGNVAPSSGLDEETLTSLIALDPMATTSTTTVPVGNLPGVPPVRGGGVTLPASRFKKDTTLIVNGASYSQNVSHTLTQSDKSSTTSTTTTVKDYHPGWLTLLGLGQNQAGKVTTKLVYGSSRTETTAQTKSAMVTLNAAPGETYTVDVNYDTIFGTFLVRTPPPPPVVVAP